MGRTEPSSARAPDGPTGFGGAPGGIASNAAEKRPTPASDRATAGSVDRPHSPSRIPTGAWVAIIALAVITAVFVGLYLNKDSSPSAASVTRSPAALSDDEPAADTAPKSVPAEQSSGESADPATAVAPTGGRIPSGTYTLPDGLNPGAYRVGNAWRLYDSASELIDWNEMKDGPALLIITDDSAGTIAIEGGAVRVEDGSLDPFQYRDGVFVVGYDIEPGTYRVTTATAPVDSLILWRLDHDLKPLQMEQSLTPESGDSLTIEVLATDYALQFEGQLEKVD